MLLGYARVSREEQHLDLQLDALKAAGVNPKYIYTEKASAKNTQRPHRTVGSFRTKTTDRPSYKKFPSECVSVD